MSYSEKIDKYLDSLKVGKSAQVDQWFMMSSPIPIVSVVIAYLVMVRLGPRLMRKREPLKIDKLMTYYNAIQVLLSVLICFKTLRLPHLFRDGILLPGCRYPFNTLNPQLLDVGWWYCFAKLTELLDTVFFVLRKKDKQVTFLHVYHHGVMAIFSWSYLKFAAAGQGAILGLLNSAVHVVMYSYYLLSGFGPRFQKYLWWKKYVTKLQMIQFILMLLYCFVTHISPRCEYTPGFTYFISANVGIFLILFLNFYFKSYRRKCNKEDKIKKEIKNIQTSIVKNGFKEINGSIKKDCENKKNGTCINCCQNIPKLEDIPYEVQKLCGDFTKNGKVYLSRRTAKAAFGLDCDFDSLRKK